MCFVCGLFSCLGRAASFWTKSSTENTAFAHVLLSLKPKAGQERKCVLTADRFLRLAILYVKYAVCVYIFRINFVQKTKRFYCRVDLCQVDVVL